MNLPDMKLLRFNNTDLCESNNEAFQAWLGTIETLERTGVLCTSTAAEASDDLPSEYRLGENYPNPFNPTTTIQIDLAETVQVSLALYDMLGQEVLRLESGTVAAGTHMYSVDASMLPSGTYLYRLETPGFSQTRRMTLLK